MEKVTMTDHNDIKTRILYGRGAKNKALKLEREGWTIIKEEERPITEKTPAGKPQENATTDFKPLVVVIPGVSHFRSGAGGRTFTSHDPAIIR